MKRINYLFLFFVFACAGSLPVTAQTKPAAAKGNDVRVAKALKQSKTEYELGKDGLYKVTYQTTGSRTQTVFAASETETVHGLEMRLIFSFAAVGGNRPEQEIADALLEENLTNFPNVWAIQKEDDGNFTIVNQTYVPADSGGKRLDDAMQSVVLAADKLEERLTKKDKF